MCQGNFKRGKSFVILFDEPEPTKNYSENSSSNLKLPTLPPATTTTSTTISTTTTKITTTTTTTNIKTSTSSALILPEHPDHLILRSDSEHENNSSAWIVLGVVISVLFVCFLALVLAHGKKSKTDEVMKSDESCKVDKTENRTIVRNV